VKASIAIALVCAIGLGCSSKKPDRGSAPAPAAKPAPFRVVLNWKPEPEFGGLYEAQRTNAFQNRNLEVQITGGPGVPVVQMVDAGDAELGVVGADEVVLARDRGADIVAVFATYQTNPQGIMVHHSRGLRSLEELFAAGGTLAVEPGMAYVKYFEKHYDLTKMKIVPYGYSIAPFLNNPMMAQQVFVTTEPIAARRQGADPQVFLIAQSGFNPYAAVIITTGKRVREDRARVAAFVAALREGWRGYLDDPTETNAVMAKLNREMDAETFRLGAEAQKPLIDDAFTQKRGIGAMSLERWTTLATQLRTLGLLDAAPKPAECFTWGRARPPVAP